MTRETKVGLIVAGSFLCLVCIVVASKMRHGDDPAKGGTEEQTINNGIAAVSPKQNAPAADAKKVESAKDAKSPTHPEPQKKPLEASAPPSFPVMKPPKDQPPTLIVPPPGLTPSAPPPTLVLPPKAEDRNPNVVEFPKPGETPPSFPSVAAKDGPPAFPSLPVPKDAPLAPKDGPPTFPSLAAKDGPPAFPSIAAKEVTPLTNKNPPDPLTIPKDGPPTFPSLAAKDAPPTFPSLAAKDAPPTFPTLPAPKDGPPVIPVAKDGPPTFPSIAAKDGPPTFPTLPAPKDGPPVIPAANDGPPTFPTLTMPKDGPPTVPTLPKDTAGPTPPPLGLPTPLPGSDTKAPPSIATVPGDKMNPVPRIPSGDLPSTPPILTTPAFTSPGSKPMPMIRDTDIHVCQPGDTNFAVLSQRFYGTDKYAQALLKYNRDNYKATVNGSVFLSDAPALQPGQQVHVAPQSILDRDYLTVRPVSTTPIPTIPSVNAPPVLSKPLPLNPGVTAVSTPRVATSATSYVVQNPNGESILDIAERVLGDRGQWHKIWRVNPSYPPQYRIPVGTKLEIPAN